MITVRCIIAAIAAIALVSPTSASGWKTLVEDKLGIRSIAMMGTEGDTEERGIVLVCTGISEGYPPSIFVSTSAWKDYSISPGHKGTLTVAGIELVAEFTRNDSAGTMAVAEQEVELQSVLQAIAASPASTEIALAAGGKSDAVLVPRHGLDVALTEFRAACGL